MVGHYLEICKRVQVTREEVANKEPRNKTILQTKDDRVQHGTDKEEVNIENQAIKGVGNTNNDNTKPSLGIVVGDPLPKSSL